MWDVIQQFTKAFPSPEGNLKIIVLCVVAATTFWFFSALNKSDYTTKIAYPVTFQYDTDSTVLLGELPDNVIVDVTGGGWNLLRKTFSIDSPPIIVELEEPTKTPFILGSSLTPNISEKLEGDLRLNYVATDTIFLKIEKKAEKEIVLTIDSLLIDLADNYRVITPVTIVPKTIRVTGPETQISEVPDTLMIQIPEDEISKNYEETLPLTYDDAPYIRLMPNQAEIRFEVASFMLLTQEVRPVFENFPEDNSLTLAQDVISISFWMPEDLLDNDDSLYFEVVADLQKMDKTDSTVVPELRAYPPQATDILLLPTQLKVIDANVE